MTGCDSSKTKKSATTDAQSERDEETAAKRNEFSRLGMRDLEKSQKLEEIICQFWNNKSDMADLRSAGNSSFEMVARGFCFFDDGTLIKNPRGEYIEGKWTLQQEKKPFMLNITLSNGARESYRIGALTPESLKLGSTNGEKGNEIMEYIADAVGFQDNTLSPFYITNNLWRIAPKKKETTEQLTARLKGLIHFFVMYYDYCITTNSEIVNFTGFPSCFRWYSGGIFLQKEEELKPDWFSCFYNKEQANECYRIAEKLMEHKYTWPKGETNWVKQNVFVLKQMEKQL